MDFWMNAVKETMEIKISETKESPGFFSEVGIKIEDTDIPVESIEIGEATKTYLITRNEGLEGEVHPITGVPFERKSVQIGNGDVVEGVFPEFPFVFEAEIPETLFTESDYKQFKECNQQLLDEIDKKPELKNKFTEEQIEQIKEGITDGTAPDGYVWHHSYLPGKIQLVDFEIHAGTGHTGGRSVWGGGNEYR